MFEYQGSDPRDAAEILDLKVLNGGMGSELLFDVQEELDKSLRVEDTALEKVGIFGRNFHVELFSQQASQLSLNSLVIRIVHSCSHPWVAARMPQVGHQA